MNQLRLYLAIASLAVLLGCNVDAPSGTLRIHVTAGPVCPVETDPPDPNCAPREVADAPIRVMPADGSDIVIAEGRTDATGRLTLMVPVGDYLVIGGDVEGLMGAPEPAPVSVVEDEAADLELAYDTGIR